MDKTLAADAATKLKGYLWPLGQRAGSSQLYHLTLQGNVRAGTVSYAVRGGFEYGVSTIIGPVCSGGEDVKAACQHPEDASISCDSPLVAEPSRGQFPNFLNQTRIPGNCASDYLLIRLYRVSTGLNSYSECQQQVRVRDDTDPTFNIQDSTITVECGQPVPAPPAVVATDNCDAGPIAVNYCEERTNGTCPTEYFLTRTWYVLVYV